MGVAGRPCAEKFSRTEAPSAPASATASSPVPGTLRLAPAPVSARHLPRSVWLCFLAARPRQSPSCHPAPFLLRLFLSLFVGADNPDEALEVDPIARSDIRSLVGSRQRGRGAICAGAGQPRFRPKFLQEKYAGASGVVCRLGQPLGQN